MNRIAIRFLLNQHLSLFNEDWSKANEEEVRRIGAIDEKCNVLGIAQDAANDAQGVSRLLLYRMCEPKTQ